MLLQFSKLASFLEGWEGVTIHILGGVFCGIILTLFNVAFVAWLESEPLQYLIACILKGCKGVAIIISAVLVLVLLDYVNPVQLWLCGLVRRIATRVCGMWTRTLITQSLIIRRTWGIIFLNAAPIQQVGNLFGRLGRGYNSHLRGCVLWEYLNPV